MSNKNFGTGMPPQSNSSKLKSNKQSFETGNAKNSPGSGGGLGLSNFPFDLNNLFHLNYSFDVLKQAIEHLALN
jgi:hypothetical protein